MIKKPTVVIYWTDSRALLSYQEKRDLEFYGSVIAVTPQEVLLEDAKTGRKVAIRGTTDPYAPTVPPTMPTA
jgi:hypothetical protein